MNTLKSYLAMKLIEHKANIEVHPFRIASVGCDGYWGIQHNKLYIVFEGTNELRDYIIDAMIWTKSVPHLNFDSDIRVHTGFNIAYLSMREKIHNIIKENYELEKIFICGHSLGGAISTLAAVDIQYNFSYLDIEVVTFGAPPVGNKAFVESYNKRVPNTYRIVNDSDLVPRFSVILWFMGYRHVSEEIHVGEPKHWWKFSRPAHMLDKYKESMNID